MSIDALFDDSSFKPEKSLIIEETAPSNNEGVNLSFSGILPGEKPIVVGHVEGMFEEGDYGDFDSIEVYSGWRGQHFGSQLFKHFVNYVQKRDVQTISISAANERTAHLMGSIEGVKDYEFFRENKKLPGFTIGLAIKELQEAREEEGLDDPDQDEMLKTVIRITAHMK